MSDTLHKSFAVMAHMRAIAALWEIPRAPAAHDGPQVAEQFQPANLPGCPARAEAHDFSANLEVYLTKATKG
jgi:hypothetical protein